MAGKRANGEGTVYREAEVRGLPALLIVRDYSDRGEDAGELGEPEADVAGSFLADLDEESAPLMHAGGQPDAPVVAELHLSHGDPLGPVEHDLDEFGGDVREGSGPPGAKPALEPQGAEDGRAQLVADQSRACPPGELAGSLDA